MGMEQWSWLKSFIEVLLNLFWARLGNGYKIAYIVFILPLSVIMIGVGYSYHLHEIAGYHIAIYLVGSGALNIAKIWTFMLRSLSEEPIHTVDTLVGVISLVWFILGNIWFWNFIMKHPGYLEIFFYKFAYSVLFLELALRTIVIPVIYIFTLKNPSPDTDTKTSLKQSSNTEKENRVTSA
ncbi:uncharacterized protein O3C94_021699 [Discoglossus pictus]